MKSRELTSMINIIRYDHFFLQYNAIRVIVIFVAIYRPEVIYDPNAARFQILIVPTTKVLMAVVIIRPVISGRGGLHQFLNPA